MAIPRIYKVAGLSLLGFCAVSIGVDRANAGPMASQVAGFCGAFLGGLLAPRQKRPVLQPEEDKAWKSVANNEI